VERRSVDWIGHADHNAEAEPVPPVRYDIRACEPPRLLAISVNDDYGTGASPPNSLMPTAPPR
jgi:hypothetical protein